jgi:hypothetical protein
VARHWGDLASLAGFGLTIWAIFKAKGAAEQARDAARQVRDRISSLDTVAALAAAVTTLEELKGLHRIRAWDLVLVRYHNFQGTTFPLAVRLLRRMAWFHPTEVCRVRRLGLLVSFNEIAHQ